MASWRNYPRKMRVKHNSQVPRCMIQVVDRTAGGTKRSKCFTVYVPMNDAIKAILEMVDKKRLCLIPPGAADRK